jgi:archaetidylinositol phosphate synthase
MKEENEKMQVNEKPHKVGKSLALHELKYSYRKVLNSFGEKIKCIHPDVISLIAFLVALAAGILYGKSGEIHVFLIVNIVFILLRMTLNTLDGLIALKRKRTSMMGKMVNALPDRYADMFILVGISFSSLCDVGIGMIASLTVLLVSYSGMLGKALGVSWQQHGPLDKVDRLVLIMSASLMQFILIKTGRYDIHLFRMSLSAMEWCMLLFIVLGHITVLNRTIGMIREIRRIERGK